MISRENRYFLDKLLREFLIDLFAKRSRAPRAAPLVASAEAKLSLRRVLVLFCGYSVKKERRGFSHIKSRGPNGSPRTSTPTGAGQTGRRGRRPLRGRVKKNGNGFLTQTPNGSIENKKPATQRAKSARRCGLTVFCFPKRVSLRCSQKTGSPCKNNKSNKRTSSWYCLLL